MPSVGKHSAFMLPRSGPSVDIKAVIKENNTRKKRDFESTRKR
jgi:hypothetical protein